jgi:small membrane protein
MGKLIQYALITGSLLIAIVFVRNQHGVRIQASKRLAFFAFLVLNVYAVLRPDDVTRIAHLLGVGRGTDLLLYALIVAFVFTVLAFYLRIHEDEQRITQLARAVAIRDAEVLNRERGLLPTVATPFTAAVTAPQGPAATP